MVTNRRLLLGPPGTGKTRRLLQEMERAIERGVPPQRIAFVSFTRAAVRHARSLACERFNLTEEELPYVRTLHSLAFYQLSLTRGKVFGREALVRLSELTGEDLTGKVELDAPTLGERGDALLFLDQYARASLVTLDDAWQHHGTPLDWFRLKRFTDAYAGMRRDENLYDFTDMLEIYVTEGRPVDVDLCLIDEAQDLTPLQWQVVERAFSNVPELVVDGDDDQGIYHWAGASADALLSFRGEKEVLAQSYRLPRTVHALASQVSSGISRRYDKLFHSTDAEGSVEWLGRPNEVDLSSGTWLLLARTRRQLSGLEEIARSQGVTYLLQQRASVDPSHVADIREYETFRAGDSTLPLWHDALTSISLDDREYLLSCLRRGESLTRTPRVRIDTIHGAKGLEADHVMLLTDINARIKRGMELDPDGEARVWYVGVTRAKVALYPVIAQRPGGGFVLDG